MSIIRRIGFLGLIAGCFSLAIGCNSGSTNSSGVIGPDGGSLTSGDGLLTLDIPAGALSSSTEISIQRMESDAPNILLYEFSPSGLNFAAPARVTVDVTGIMPNSDASALLADDLLGLVTEAPNDSGVEVLENLVLSVDGDVNAFSLGGDITHFSGIVVGGHSNITVQVEKVPQFWPAQSDFGPVEVIVANGSKVGNEPIDFVSYEDRSLDPVFIKGNKLQTFIPGPFSTETKSYPIGYRCGDPGVGLYSLELDIHAVEHNLVLSYSPEEIDIASAFLFGALGPVIEGGEATSAYVPVYRGYKVVGSRKVNCGGSAPVEPTPTPQSTPSDEPTPAPSATPSEGTPAPTATVKPTASGQTPPVISTSTSKISINHTKGQTSCPTAGPTVTIQAAGSNAVTVSVDDPLSFLNVSPSSQNTAGGSASFGTSFPCSGFQNGSNTGNISFSAVDPSTGLSSNTLVIPVEVIVN